MVDRFPIRLESGLHVGPKGEIVTVADGRVHVVHMRPQELRDMADRLTDAADHVERGEDVPGRLTDLGIRFEKEAPTLHG